MSKLKRDRKWWHGFEETASVIILVLMMVITFVNVIVRNYFEGSIVWGQDLTLYLFAWLVLFGLGYLIRTSTHLGVDAIVNILDAPKRRILGLIVAAICIIYAVLLLKGAYDYTANFYNLPATEGSFFPVGLQDMKPYHYKGYTPTPPIPMPDWLRPIWEPIFLREGDTPYDKLPINIPYLALFFGVLWMTIRFVFSFVDIYRGVSDRLIASHEVEDAIDNLAKEEA